MLKLYTFQLYLVRQSWTESSFSLVHNKHYWIHTCWYLSHFLIKDICKRLAQLIQIRVTSWQKVSKNRLGKQWWLQALAQEPMPVSFWRDGGLRPPIPEYPRIHRHRPQCIMGLWRPRWHLPHLFKGVSWVTTMQRGLQVNKLHIFL